MADNSSEECVQGPIPGVKYPIKVEYCGNCSMPFEYCEYYPDQEGCQKWLEKNLPDKFAALGVKSSADDKDAEGEDDAKKRQKRGGKGMVKAKKKEAEEKAQRELEAAEATMMGDSVMRYSKMLRRNSGGRQCSGETKGCAILDSSATIVRSSTITAEGIQIIRLRPTLPFL